VDKSRLEMSHVEQDVIDVIAFYEVLDLTRVVSIIGQQHSVQTLAHGTVIAHKIWQGELLIRQHLAPGKQRYVIHLQWMPGNDDVLGERL
jgi:hypothetical protein